MLSDCGSDPAESAARRSRPKLIIESNDLNVTIRVVCGEERGQRRFEAWIRRAQPEPICTIRGRALNEDQNVATTELGVRVYLCDRSDARDLLSAIPRRGEKGTKNQDERTERHIDNSLRTDALRSSFCGISMTLIFMPAIDRKAYTSLQQFAIQLDATADGTTPTVLLLVDYASVEAKQKNQTNFISVFKCDNIALQRFARAAARIAWSNAPGCKN